MINLKKRSPIKQPHHYVNGGFFEGEKNPYSPDPLQNYKYKEIKLNADYQIFVIDPVKITTENTDSFKNLNVGQNGEVNIEVISTGELMIDFGAEYPAWLEIDSPDLEDEILLGVSEFKQKTFANIDAQNTNKTIKPIKYGDTYRLELNNELFEGVRFGFVVIENLTKPFHITAIRLIAQTKPVNYMGSFECDNEKLNKTWYISSYVVRTNLAKDFFSSILNDRGDRFSWTGDAYVTQAASLVAFKNYDFILQNLHYTAAKPRIIESYELYWILSVIDYYYYTGDKEGTLGLLDQATRRLDYAYSIYGTDPVLGYYGWDERLGAGWEAHSIRENQNAFKGLCIRAFKEFGNLLLHLDQKELAEKYLGYAKEKESKLIKEKDWYKSFGIHALCDAINADIFDKNTANSISFNYFSNRITRLSYSPFNQYFIMQAMAKANHYDLALASILDMYGGMIDYGCTTLCEVYHPQWNDVIETNGALPNCQVGFISLGHSWGAGVLKWMNEEILGIKPLVPGFKEILIKPHLGRTLKKVKGTTPTPNGEVNIDFDSTKGFMKINIPRGSLAIVAVPKLEKKIVSIVLDNKKLNIVNEDEEYVYLENFLEGEHFLNIAYEGKTPEFVDLPYCYPVDRPIIDKETSGNWDTKYGKDGYCLFQHSPEDVRKLPDYIESCEIVSFPAVKPSRKVNWILDSNDPRALPLNGRRGLGAYYTYDIQPCTQAMVMDIIVKGKKNYKVTLYFCDYADKKAKLSIDLFDRDSFELIAPIEVISDYQNGIYVTYKVNSSIRFRLNQIRGIDVPISAVFFDKE